MARQKFSWANYLVRLVFAVVLVMATYNPTGYSYFHWVRDVFFGDGTRQADALMALAGIVLVIGWAMFLRATFRSLGILGTVLAIAFFTALLWLVVDYGLIPKDNTTAITWLILVGLSGVLSAGMSWSHVRRRASGQLDVDETDT